MKSELTTPIEKQTLRYAGRLCEDNSEIDTAEPRKCEPFEIEGLLSKKVGYVFEINKLCLWGLNKGIVFDYTVTNNKGEECNLAIIFTNTAAVIGTDQADALRQLKTASLKEKG